MDNFHVWTVLKVDTRRCSSPNQRSLYLRRAALRKAVTTRPLWRDARSISSDPSSLTSRKKLGGKRWFPSFRDSSDTYILLCLSLALGRLIALVHRQAIARIRELSNVKICVYFSMIFCSRHRGCRMIAHVETL